MNYDHRQRRRLTGLLSIAVFLFANSANCASAPRGAPPPPVSVRKCCPFGQELQIRDTIDADSTILEKVSCVPSTTTLWVPFIKYKKRDGFFTPLGDKPKFMNFVENKLPLDACDEPLHSKGANNVILVTNGDLYVKDREMFINETNRFCVDREIAIYCPPRMDGDEDQAQPLTGEQQQLSSPSSASSASWHRKKTTVRKCCSTSWAYNSKNKTCVPLLHPTNPLNTKPVFEQSRLRRTRLDMLYGFPVSCQHGNFAILGTFKPEMFDEERNVLKLENSDRQLEDDQFCLEHMVTKENDTVFSSFVTVFTCAEFFPAGNQPKQAPVERNYRFVVYAVGLFISVIFLIATLVISFLVPSNHHVLHWRCQTYYVACLLVGDFFLAITQLAGDAIREPYCSTIASAMHFSFLAAFFWLNTMCFNIWWTFRDFRPTSLERGQELCRLRIYELYAWGFPLIIAALALLFDNLPNSEDYLRPRFGERTCWFYGDKEIFTYFFAPIGALLIINIVLFVSTARQLTCGLWKRDDVKTTAEKSALGRVCMKLVVVMGITWILDVISWAIGGSEYFWYFTDFINAAQGFFIFCVVGLQPQIRVALKRFWSSNAGGNTTTNGQQHSSSSHGLPSMGESVTNNTFTNTTNNNHNSISSTTKIPLETVC